MARKFLYIIVFLTILIIGALFALNIWQREATEYAFIPRSEFVEQAPLERNAYEDPAMWYSRPGIGISDPSRWQPAPAEVTQPPSPQNPATQVRAQAPPAAVRAEVNAMIVPEAAQFAVFFVHPTSYLPLGLSSDTQWNASLGDETAETRARMFLRGLASPFNAANEIWAPKYRQAAVGTFLTDKPEAAMAIDAAYRDVEQAFAYFLDSIDADKPIVLAGHSQGALHIIRLLEQKIAGTPLQSRVAAVYPIGWPISVEHDLPALGLPACATGAQSGCIVSWSSFAEPADPAMLLERYSSSTGLDGKIRGNSQILCTNPLTGQLNGDAPASANLGTLVPDGSMETAELIEKAVPARCDERGLLLIGDPPQLGSAVLPGNNYHVYDIPLFWRNLQEDVARRVSAWAKAR
ncbi:DUF3089 domain-containing protein [Altererythrobacter aquiaggeris]|uniref:DUF3089 domain-containing protein n=1 Tax=Aestuarierythrobacter aquiaggeris TaxID=1898396 RepID=UPI003015B4C2